MARSTHITPLEICVDTFAGALAAQEGGADRVELCSALSEGGLTPSVGLMRQAATLSIPVYAMIRPRSGLFHFSDADEAIMLADIRAAKEAGLDGVVLGAQQRDHRLDVPRLARLLTATEGMGSTLHRVIDVVPDPLEALDAAIQLGFDRVLTSGAAPEAIDGADMLRDMVARAAGRISVMAGCGLTHENVAALVRETGVTETHAACADKIVDERIFSDFSPAGGRVTTSKHMVQMMKGALEQ
ncbi:copper homeostasis protein [Aliiroseovarius halocynthiae]|uniref:PF03932 family protein CutC n=1 Tax=Aliiroseovarius halocynthiae TaxID=985055 RepID=A0A545SV14_9RHOB|nr:copper homeostasis protein CutC [Aliiroseovarius halocynthiae]TQV68803.1 copper homeostasis protein CutC [Aliiroseovarius halocynthiae]SMR71229.1 copper homeostasis protein [Aliiroseovarius halocynthiae]